MSAIDCLNDTPSMVPEAEAWLALTTKPRHEKVASIGLRSKGCEEFLPLYRVRNRWSDRTKEVDLPLFPGYVFCRPQSMLRNKVLATPGVRSFVEFGDGPVCIPESEMTAVRKLVESGLPLGPLPFLQVGQKVLIKRGALSGVEGILLEIKDSLRLVVSINLLQRSVAAVIDRDFLL